MDLGPADQAGRLLPGRPGAGDLPVGGRRGRTIIEPGRRRAGDDPWMCCGSGASSPSGTRWWTISSVQFNMMTGPSPAATGDYVTLFEPTATEVEQQGKGNPVLHRPGKRRDPYTAFCPTAAMWRRIRETSGLRQRHGLAQQWWRITDRQVAEAIRDQFRTRTWIFWKRVCARHREIDAWNRTPVMEQAALERLETVMTQAGELARTSG